MAIPGLSSLGLFLFVLVVFPYCLALEIPTASRPTKLISSSKISEEIGFFSLRGNAGKEGGRTSVTNRFQAKIFAPAFLLCSMLVGVPGAPPSRALDATAPAIASGVIDIKRGVQEPAGDSAALFVTARPKADGVFSAKSVAIATAKFEHPQFPFEFKLEEDSLTPEGLSTIDSWRNKDLTVSCRLDADGVAFTRDPEDLVGQGTLLVQSKKTAANAETSGVSILLQDRGAGGKILTTKQQKK